MTPDRTSVTERPLAAQDRYEIGHCEYDSVVSSKRSGSAAVIAVLSERTSRLVQAKLVTNLKPKPYAKVITELTNGLEVRTLTTDNGIENKRHKLVTWDTEVPAFFTDP